MIVHRRDVRARAPADFTHRRVAKADLGKHLARRLQQLTAGFCDIVIAGFDG